MNRVTLNKKDFYSDHFWSMNDQSKIAEDVFAKEYLSNYFTLKDIFKLYQMIGRDRLLEYAAQVDNRDRIEHLLDILDRY